MKELLNRLEGWHLVLIVIVTGVAVTEVIEAVRRDPGSATCRDLAHGNIQAYESCVRAERGR